jgi:hypothetical protein
LHQGVHAGVGAARANDGDGLGRELAKRVFQTVLHGAARTLALPAFVRLAVITDAQREPHRQAFDRAEWETEIGVS